MAVAATTVKVSNIPLTVIAKELLEFFDDKLGKESVYALEIFTERKNWKSKGFGLVQFETIDAANTVNLLSSQGKLVFRGTHLSISPSFKEIIVRPVEVHNRVGHGVLHVGFLIQNDRLNVLDSWNSVKAEIMPERKRIEFWVVESGETYKLVIQFGDIVSSSGCCLNGEESNAVLLKLKYAPKICQKISGPSLASNFSPDRYSICKENFEFLWVRTTDFSVLKSIGQSSSLCWQLQKGTLASDILNNFPRYEGELGDFTLEHDERSCFGSELVPLVRCPLDSKLSYEILFLLNSLVHAQKISLTAVNTDVIEILSSLSMDTATKILQKLRKVKSTCYEVMSLVQSQLHSLRGDQKHQPSSSQSRLTERNLMSCHRVLVTPSKVYFLGPEVETSNYVVKHFAAYASDFMRVNFVEEDWSKLPSDAITTSIEQGIFCKPYRTSIYHRILSVLRDGIVIGAKRFEFLAFSASQLRSNSVWMFASNDKVRSEDVREWMGCFNKIRSVSKCAARMGQLFSSSLQTLTVPAQDVEIIPDVEVNTDGIKYCFSDGIGKISLSFAKQVAQKCGLNHIPSAFQIRYGGYKGVIALDRNSFRKLSLRPSMLKFDSKNRMLNITSWSESMPCYLNREIVSLLSTLGIDDEKFMAMQQEQIHRLDKMLTSREAALNVLEGMNGGDIKSILVKMLLQGYEPSSEPYLLMMLRAHREYQLSDIRSKCRIFVSKARVLMGCLDETATLNYGQVFIRVTMTRAELQCGDAQTFFQKVDDKTSIVVGKVVVTKNPCLHPGDIRVLEAVYEPALEEKGLVDCLVFPQKGERPHPNECSGGDLDGDLFFVCWDDNLIPLQSDTPMDYIARRPRLMDHDVTLEEIQKFFVDYMINDTLGMISTAHLVHADCEPEKARSSKCRQLATLHSMAVDFAKTGAPAEMPRVLRPKEYPDFMEREDRAMYISSGVLGKLYRATIEWKENHDPNIIQSEIVAQVAYDDDLEVNGFEAFLETAENHKNMYVEKFSALMNYYGAECEEEMLTGNLRELSVYLQRDKRRYTEMKDRILDSIKSLQKEAKGWFHSSCKDHENTKMASAWYHVTYHPKFCQNGKNYLSFPWIVGDILLNIKSIRSRSKD
ncbi:RNA recognition motif domain [Macleaya cordata]|uniref:RNA-dependent RNA polymerase n=1 Tax=Macleaya cordata TaxID=56857 RepID=A0A200PZS9_MACCD|nr:RNA recognition motif domain [Macleaya cordata]